MRQLREALGSLLAIRCTTVLDKVIQTFTAEIHSALSSTLNCRHSLRTLGVVHSAPYTGNGRSVMAAATSAAAVNMAT